MICPDCQRDTLHVRQLGVTGDWICRPCNFSPLRFEKRRGDRRLRRRARPGRRVEDLVSYEEILAGMDEAFDFESNFTNQPKE